MITHIKQNRYQHRRLFHHAHEGGADTPAPGEARIAVAQHGNASFSSKRIVPHTIDEQMNMNTHRRMMNQMVQSFPDDREARTMHLANTERGGYLSSYDARASTVDYTSTTSSMIGTTHESYPTSRTSSSRSDGFDQQEELSIITMIDEILSN